MRMQGLLTDKQSVRNIVENFRASKVQKNVINMQSINAIYVTFDLKKIARPE